MQMAPVSWSCTVRVSGNNHVVMLLLSLWEVLGVGSCFSEQTSFFRDLYHWLWTTGDGSRNCPAIIVLWKTAFKFALQLQGCKLRGQNWSHLLSPFHFFLLNVAPGYQFVLRENNPWCLTAESAGTSPVHLSHWGEPCLAQAGCCCKMKSSLAALSPTPLPPGWSLL